MNAELSDHLGYQKHDPAGYKSGNSRNAKTKKTLKGDVGEMELETPRDHPDALDGLRRAGKLYGKNILPAQGKIC